MFLDTTQNLVGIVVGIVVGQMKIKNKVFKRKTGKSKDKWIVRIEYLDELTGKTKFIERHAEKKGEATDLRDKLVDDVKKSHGQMQTGERMTFNQLADICEQLFYRPAEIVEGRKVAGIRSIAGLKPQINNLRSFFWKTSNQRNYNRKSYRIQTLATKNQLRTIRSASQNRNCKPRSFCYA